VWKKKGVIAEILGMVKDLKIPVERVNRQKIDSLGGNPQGVALETAPTRTPTCTVS
jgi:tRNA G18 (ribose-2'-O)-methylase SpoU